MMRADRRVQRTHKLLQQALIALIRERGYDAISVQDIVERAGLGRTTFYLHYGSKDELFLSCHESVLGELHGGPLFPRSREELLASEAPAGLAAAFRHLEHARALLAPIFVGQDHLLVLRRMRSRSAQQIEASLRAAFAGVESSIPLDVLASYLAGTQIALLQWWLEQRQPHAPEALAQALHRLRRAAVRDAFGLAGD